MNEADIRKLSALTAFFVILLSSFAVAFSVDAYAASSESVKIMPLGDSITEGFVVFENGTIVPDPVGYRQKLYVDLTNAGYDVDFVGSRSYGSSRFPPYFDTDHEGWGGHTAGMLNSMLNGLLSANPPDIVLYHIGTNSLYGGDMGQAALDVNESLRIIYAFDPGIEVVLAKIIRTMRSDLNTKVHSYNLLLEQYANQWRSKGYSIVVVDMEFALYPSLGDWGDYSNFVHPSDLGYRKMAGFWFNALQGNVPHSSSDPPFVTFTSSPAATAYVNAPVSFDASGSYSYYGSITNYLWNFGDGITYASTSSRTTHTYTSSGSFQVQLTVTEDSGLSNSIAKALTLVQDSFPPATAHDYDSAWHTSDFRITLSAADNGSGVAATYYRMNAGLVQRVSVNGQPFITTEGAANTLEYWSVDILGNEELPHKMLANIRLDKAAPTGTIQINAGAAYTTSVSVTLTLAANDAISGVKRVRLSNDGVWDTETWESFSQTRSWALSPGEGGKAVYLQIQDNAGLTSTVLRDEIFLDTAPPTGSVIVNRGEAYANSTLVTLALTAIDGGSGIGQVRFSNDGVWDTEEWETYASTKSWSLAAGQGPRTVYYQIRDKAGHESNTYSDTITLDTSGPTGSITISGGEGYTTSTGVLLTLQAVDAGVGVSQIRLSNDGVWDSELWEAPTNTKSWLLTDGGAAKTVFYQIVDKAGLVSDIYTDTIILDTDAPAGSILINEGNLYTTSSTVTLKLEATDAGSGVWQIRLSNDGVWDTESWEASSANKGWTLLSGEGTKKVYYQIKDKANFVSSTYSATIVLDSTAPAGSIIINNGAACTNVTGVDLALSAADSVSGVSQMRFSNDGSAWSSWELYSNSKSWSLQAGEGMKNVFVQYRDFAGLNVTAYASITLDFTPPIASAGQSQTVEVNASVTFSGVGSSDNTGIASYLWDFGDGKSGTGATPTHIYTDVGTYTATLTVVDLGGNRAASSSAVSIEVVYPRGPLILLGILLIIPLLAGALFFRKKFLGVLRYYFYPRGSTSCRQILQSPAFALGDILD